MKKRIVEANRPSNSFQDRLTAAAEKIGLRIKILPASNDQYILFRIGKGHICGVDAGTNPRALDHIMGGYRHLAPR